MSVLVVAGTLLQALPAAAQLAPTNCSVVSQNLYVRDVMLDVYYWYQFIPPVNAAGYPSPESYLEAVRYRPLDSYFSYIASAAASEAFYSESQYIGFGFSSQITGTEMRVLQVFDDSPAAEAGLGRGHRITQIDGQSVAALIRSGQIDRALGPSEIGYSVEIAFDTREGLSTRATLTKRLVTIPTVSVTRVFDVGGRRVGYVFFRNFVRPSFAALDEAFSTLREAGATELVLDLRYNGGGLVDVAVHLSSLIGGKPTSGQVLATYEHNDKNSAYNRTLRFESLETPGFSRLIAITTRASASASELVLNALRPYLPVVIIGDATYGKPVGQYGFTFCDKVLFPVSFTIRNANGEADYFDGLQPTCAAPDDISRDLGDPAEGSFAEALTYLRTGACSPRAAEASRTLRAADQGRRSTGWQSVVNAY